MSQRIFGFLLLPVLTWTQFMLDNEVIGVPAIQCTDTAISFSVRTRNPFQGNIYIKGLYAAPGCRQEYFANDYPGATFNVRLGECGMRRVKQLQPPGVNYILIFTVSFHPQFLTRIDRAYNVRCFYALAEKTVASELDVDQLPTQSVEQATAILPSCVYSVRAGTPDGPVITRSRIGDQVVHRWECDNPNYGMLVKNCFVNNGAGVSVRVLDARGCPVTNSGIQGGLSYSPDLNLAYVPLWAYGFPDQSHMFYQCQIQVCSKREGECNGITPPNCPVIAPTLFRATSQLIPGVDPTQVVATFDGRLGLGPPYQTRLHPVPIRGVESPPGVFALRPFQKDDVNHTLERQDERQPRRVDNEITRENTVLLSSARQPTEGSFLMFSTEKFTTTTTPRTTTAKKETETTQQTTTTPWSTLPMKLLKPADPHRSLRSFEKLLFDEPFAESEAQLGRENAEKEELTLDVTTDLDVTEQKSQSEPQGSFPISKPHASPCSPTLIFVLTGLLAASFVISLLLFIIALRNRSYSTAKSTISSAVESPMPNYDTRILYGPPCLQEPQMVDRRQQHHPTYVLPLRAS